MRWTDDKQNIITVLVCVPAAFIIGMCITLLWLTRNIGG